MSLALLHWKAPGFLLDAPTNLSIKMTFTDAFKPHLLEGRVVQLASSKICRQSGLHSSKLVNTSPNTQLEEMPLRDKTCQNNHFGGVKALFYTANLQVNISVGGGQCNAKFSFWENVPVLLAGKEVY